MGLYDRTARIGKAWDSISQDGVEENTATMAKCLSNHKK